MFKLMGKKIFTILHSKMLLSKPMEGSGEPVHMRSLTTAFTAHTQSCDVGEGSSQNLHSSPTR